MQLQTPAGWKSSSPTWKRPETGGPEGSLGEGRSPHAVGQRAAPPSGPEPLPPRPGGPQCWGSRQSRGEPWKPWSSPSRCWNQRKVPETEKNISQFVKLKKVDWKPSPPIRQRGLMGLITRALASHGLFVVDEADFGLILFFQRGGRGATLEFRALSSLPAQFVLDQNHRLPRRLSRCSASGGIVLIFSPRLA